MARRSDHSRDELHRISLDAAEAEIAAGGLAGLSVRRVAQRIGYSHGTLYTIFRDLDDLVLQVNLRTLARLEAALAAAPRGGGVAAEARALAGAYLSFVAANGPLWQALFDHRMSDGATVPDWYAEAVARPLRSVEILLAPRFPRPEDCHATAVALWAALQGIASLAASGKLAAVTTEPPQRLAALLVDGVVGR